MKRKRRLEGVAFGSRTRRERRRARRRRATVDARDIRVVRSKRSGGRESVKAILGGGGGVGGSLDTVWDGGRMDGVSGGTDMC